MSIKKRSILISLTLLLSFVLVSCGDKQSEKAKESYEDIDLIKFNDIVKYQSDSSLEELASGDNLNCYFNYYYYLSDTDMKKAFHDYCDYLNTNGKDANENNYSDSLRYFDVDGQKVEIGYFNVEVDEKYMLYLMYEKTTK